MSANDWKDKFSTVGLNTSNFIAIFSLVFAVIAAYPILKDIFIVKKSLSYSISSAEVFNSKNTPFKLLYGGTQVQSVKRLLISIENDGQDPLLSEDFITPLEITLSSDCKILESNIVKSDPPSANAGFTSGLRWSTSNVNFKPPLLNNGDSVDIAILSSSCASPNAVVTARIKGVKHVNLVAKKSSGSLRDNINKVILITYTVLIALFAYLTRKHVSRVEENKYLRSIFEMYDDEIKKNEMIKRADGFLAISRRKVKQYGAMTTFLILYVVFYIIFIV